MDAGGEAISSQQPPIPIPRTTLKYNATLVSQFDQAAANSRVAVPSTLYNLLPTNTTGLLDFGKYPIRDVFSFTLFPGWRGQLLAIHNDNLVRKPIAMLPIVD